MLLRNIRLGTVIEYAVNEYYQVSYKLVSLTVYDWRTSDRFEIAAFAIIITDSDAVTIDLNLKNILSNDVTVYRNDETFRVFSTVIAKYEDIFMNFGNIIDILEK